MTQIIPTNSSTGGLLHSLVHMGSAPATHHINWCMSNSCTYGGTSLHTIGRIPPGFGYRMLYYLGTCISMDPHHVQAISPTTEYISTLHYHSYHLYPELRYCIHPKFLSFRVPLPPKLGQGRSVTLGPILVSPHPCMYSSTCQPTEPTYHQYPVCPTLGCTPTEPNSTWKDHQSWSRWK